MNFVVSFLPNFQTKRVDFDPATTAVIFLDILAVRDTGEIYKRATIMVALCY